MLAGKVFPGQRLARGWGGQNGGLTHKNQIGFELD
jgi:hypothetical protein